MISKKFELEFRGTSYAMEADYRKDGDRIVKAMTPMKAPETVRVKLEKLVEEGRPTPEEWKAEAEKVKKQALEYVERLQRELATAKECIEEGRTQNINLSNEILGYVRHAVVYGVV